MGDKVREPDKKSPPKSRLDTCPHCNNRKRVINGAWLRWKRESAGMDQRAFAKMLGISGPYLSDIERNRRDCPSSILVAYSSLRRVS